MDINQQTSKGQTTTASEQEVLQIASAIVKKHKRAFEVLGQ